MAIFNSELLNYQRVSVVGYKGYHRNTMGTTTLKFFFYNKNRVFKTKLQELGYGMVSWPLTPVERFETSNWEVFDGICRSRKNWTNWDGFAKKNMGWN